MGQNSRTNVPLAKGDKYGKMDRTPHLEAKSVPASIAKSEWRWALLWAVVIVGLTCLPYLIAWQLAPEGTQYTGLLINHLDGESYYAKMRQGARGDWLFHLPFTPEPHEGTFIFAFYLALGQLAGALNVPIPVVYHIARAGSGLFFLLVGYRFIALFYAFCQFSFFSCINQRYSTNLL